MAVKKITSLTLGDSLIEGPESVQFNADNGIEFNDFYSPLGFAKCALKKEMSRTVTVQAKDVGTLSGLENTSGGFTLELAGECGGADVTVGTTDGGNVFYHNFKVDPSAQGDRKTATIEGIFYSITGVEPAYVS